MRQGHSAAWDQQWDRAIAAYRKALDELPDEPAALTSLGLAFFQSNQLDDALAVYQRAVQVVPDDPLAHEKSAEILERLGRLDDAVARYLAAAEIHLNRRDVAKAIENWERAARLAPEQLATHTRLAMAYERTGDSRQAVHEYLTLGHLFQAAGEKAKALQAAQRALQLDPQSHEAAQAVKSLQQGAVVGMPPRTKGKTGALRMARVQTFMAPDNAANGAEAPAAGLMELAQKKALSALASLLFDETADSVGGSSAGLDAITRGLSGAIRKGRHDRNKVIVHLGQAIDQHTQGSARDAIADYEKAIANGLDHPAAHYNLGSLQLAQGDAAAALPHLKSALTHPDYAAGSAYGIGQIHFQSNQFKDALLQFLHALKLIDQAAVPDDLAEFLSQRYETMIDSVSNADPDDETGKIAENVQRFLAGADWRARLDEARRQLDAQGDPRNPSPVAELMLVAGTDRVVETMTRIDMYLKRGFLQSAMEEAYAALEVAPTYLPIHLRMAEILLEENRLEASIAKYSVVAETYRIRGEPMRAAHILEEVVRFAPMNLEMRTRLIDLLTEMDQNDRAMGQFMDLAETYYRLADLERARETYSNALKVSQRSRSDRAWSTQILHRMGDIDQQRLDWRQALRVYDQIKTLSPNDDKARGTLIDLNLRLGQTRQAVAELDDYLRFLLGSGEVQPAIGVLETLVRERPDEAAFRARLAKLYQDTGRKADAIAQLDALGELQLEAGNRDEARATIHAILALGPEDPSGYEQLLRQLGG